MKRSAIREVRDKLPRITFTAFIQTGCGGVGQLNSCIAILATTATPALSKIGYVFGLL